MIDKWLKIGSLIWTGCAAGWLVLGIVTGLAECYIVGLGCAVMSYLFHAVGEFDDDGS